MVWQWDQPCRRSGRARQESPWFGSPEGDCCRTSSSCGLGVQPTPSLTSQRCVGAADPDATKGLDGFSEPRYQTDRRHFAYDIFCEIENIVNSRPMTKISDDVTDDVPLKPNHLLLMRGNLSYPWGVFYGGEVYRRHWKHAQNIVKVFWKRWLREYFPELQKRQKWLGIKSNLKVGDLVLVMDENAPKGSWPLGLIQEVSVGRDGLVRSARLKTVTSVLTRPITKLVSLECDV